MIQARSVAEQLSPYCEIEIVPIKTSGDRGHRETLGAFVKEIQEELLQGNVEIALHCLKDLPTTRPEGLALTAYLEREDARDALLTLEDSWESLKDGAIVGTGSVRRSAQLAHWRPDLKFKPLVGNVDTRLGKLESGDYDAIVLAMAGLNRMGDRIRRDRFQVAPFSIDTMVPSPGQAVLVLETRDDQRSIQVAANLNDREATACGTAERAFLARFGGGCSVPVGAIGTVNGNRIHLKGRVVSADGRRLIQGETEEDLNLAEEAGERLASELGLEGAFEIVRETLAMTRPAVAAASENIG